MKKIFVLSLVVMVSLTMMSCMHIKVGDKDLSLGSMGRGNDTPTQVNQVGQETAMQPFDVLNVAGPFNVIMEQAAGNSVRVEGTAEQLGKITIYVKDNELIIDKRESKSNGNDFKGMRIFVSLPSIKHIDIAGSGTVTAPNVITADDLGLEVAGSGGITLAQLNCEDLDIEIAGSGNVTTGPIQAKEVKSEIAGSGDISITGLMCKKLHNEIVGSGDMTFTDMNVDEVHSEIAGSGDIILRGKVGTHSEEIVGSGKVDVTGLIN